MDHEPSHDTKQLYADAMELFRSNRWAEALAAFRRLQESTDAYPEIQTLIADIQLKLELERLSTPTDSLQPKRPRWLPYLAGLLVTGLLIGGGVAASGILTQATPAPTPVRTARVVSLPTAAPTSTPRPSPTPFPTATPLPTATPPPTELPTEAPTVVAEPGLLLVQTADGGELTRTTGNIAIILDASGSMLAKVGQKRKIEIAREALTTLVGQLSDTTQVALSSYGIRATNGCSSIEELAPLAPLNRDALLEIINGVEPAPNSPTPIGLALQKMAASLRTVTTDTLVVLVSDGEETCDADPAAIAAEIHAASPQIRVAVVGFNIGTDIARTRLSSIAESGGGPYFDASDAPQLISALRQAITLNYQVRDSQGATVYAGPVGSQVPLDAGRYTVTIGDSDALTFEVDIQPAQQTSIQIREQNGVIQGDVVNP